MTLFFEDFAVSKEFASGFKRLKQKDIDDFARLTGDQNKLHVDKDFAKGTIFGGRIAHGILVLSMALGMWYGLNLTRASLIALLAIDDVAFRAPVYPGDGIKLVSRVMSKRLSRTRPGAGIVVFKDEVVNDKGKAVLEFQRVLLLRTAAGGEKGSS